MLKRQFGYRRLDRVHEEERREQQRAKWRGGGGCEEWFQTARSRPPEAGTANNHVSEPSPSAADANGKGGGRMLVSLRVVVVFKSPTNRKLPNYRLTPEVRSTPDYSLDSEKQ